MALAEKVNTQDLQASSRLWWQTHPMSYDWHRSIRLPEGTPEFFDEIDRRFFSSSPYYRGKRPFERWIPFEDLKEKRVLEVGCGLGAHAQLLSEAGCNLTCIDLTSRAVELTRKRLTLRGWPADIRVMDGEQMAFPDAEFDFVWSWGVIHHSADIERVLREVHRVLKPSREFRLMVYHQWSMYAGISLLRGLLSGKFFKGMSVSDVLSAYSDGYLARYYTKAGLAQLLERCGFETRAMHVLGQKAELVPIPGSGFSGEVKSTLLQKIPDRLAESLLERVGSFLFAVAVKKVV